MKTSCFSRSFNRWLAPSFIVFMATVSYAQAQLQRPTITSIRQQTSNIIVNVSVPVGVQRVVLESRERINVGSWEPRAVIRTGGSGGSYTFRIPCTRRFESLRVRADATDPLPASFYTGETNFVSESDGSVTFNADGTAVVSTMDVPGTRETTTPEREVVESDIWQMRGTTLYFFNQNRGLQVIDIAKPETPVIRGTLDLPGAGEQMYLLGSDYVVLLAVNSCWSSAGESQVMVIADKGTSPTVVASLPVPGYIQESRMVGTALYVASSTMRPAQGADNSYWEWGTMVSSFDLADPENPVKRESFWFSGYGNVISATDDYLFVVTQNPTNYYSSFIEITDITAPDGTMRPYNVIQTIGRVPDKFKLNYSDAVFTAISEYSGWNGNSWVLFTALETFHLPDPRWMGPIGTHKLGQVELGRGERLRGTRFDGNRVYVVTFFQIDPLWVVDISDPARPKIAGSVDVPGWSTYIQPLGNQLVTMGVESNRVAVSLFDVQDSSKPTLLSRVRLGECWSWSEANYDEKALSIFPQEGLILVPYSGTTSNGYSMQVQLIDLKPTELVTRGMIEHEFQPRRATLYNEYVLSLSGWELLSVDATDRDDPELRSRLELAWPVDRVFVRGPYLIELNNSSYGWWGAEPNHPTLRVTLASAPNNVLTTLTLSNLPILGVAEEGDKLYIAQGNQNYWYWPPIEIMPMGSEGEPTKEPPNFFLSVIDLANLPQVEVIGSTSVQSKGLGWGSDLQGVFPRPGVLVWSGGGAYYWGYYDVLAPMRVGMIWPPYWYGSGGTLLAFDLSNPIKPVFASEVNLSGNNSWWSFSQPFTANGLLYISHQASEYIYYPYIIPMEGGGTVEPGTVDPTTTVEPSYRWVCKDFLDVVDYADPMNPTVRKPVNISGTLQGVAYEGALLYALSTRYQNTGYVPCKSIDALAYDGVSAHRVDSLRFTNTWWIPLVVKGDNIFVGRGSTDTSSPVPSEIQTWTLADTGKFMQLGKVPLSSPPSQLAIFDDLLAVPKSDRSIDLFDCSEPATLRPIGQGKPAGCFYFDILRADGNMLDGLWLPMGSYGVYNVPVTK